MNPTTFTHPYSWYWSWIDSSKGLGYWYIAAPYGRLWYWLNSPAQWGFLPWMLYLFIVDTVASAWVMTHGSWRYMIPWMLSSQFSLNWDGPEYFPFLFSSLGGISPLFSVLALVVKLPLGAPGYVWDFVLHSPYSASGWFNWPRYIFLGAWWIYGVATFYLRHRGLNTYIRSMLRIPVSARKDFD